MIQKQMPMVKVYTIESHMFKGLVSMLGGGRSFNRKSPKGGLYIIRGTSTKETMDPVPLSLPLFSFLAMRWVLLSYMLPP